MRALAIATVALLASGHAARAEPSVSILPLPFAVAEFRAPGTRVAELIPSTDALREDRALREAPLAVVWGPGGAAALVLRDGVVKPLRLGGVADIAALETGRDAIPASRVAASGPSTVSLTAPSRAYSHEALGSGVHAGAVTIAERRPPEAGGGVRRVPTATSRVEAGAGAVFEDRAPRLADLDGDGTPEIVTVKSYLDRGSALAVIGRREGAWQILAETPPIGASQRWLNPAAIADFDGTGRPQIALVRTPHIDGVLQLWAYADGRLTKLREQPGYANHANGRTAQDLAAILTVEGRPMLVIPTLDRSALALLDLRGAIRERWRVALPARAATGVAVLGRGADARILVGLEDGRVADVRP